jgi:ribonuclease HI
MRVFTDAARDSEVSGMGWEVVLDDQENVEGSRYLIGDYTSMEAEYFALLDGLRHARRQDKREVEVYCDCEPLIEKMRVPDTNEVWYDRRRGCHRLLNKFDSWELEWTPRSGNSGADRLAYEALERGRRQQELP